MIAAIKALAVLVLAGVMVWAPAQVTAEHDKFFFDVPHEIAETLLSYNLHIAGPGEYFTALGCDIVWTLPLHGLDGALFGYAIHAKDDTGERLVVVEVWDKATYDKVFSYVNAEDYDSLKKCHENAKGGIAI